MAAAACTPVLDWRDVHPDGTSLRALFPCKPTMHTRRLLLANAPVEMALYVCSTGGVTYALGHADVGEPQWVGAALRALAEAAAGNVGASGPTAAEPFAVQGMTPNAGATRLTVHGQLHDGQRIDERVANFAHGTRVFQATMVGPRLDVEAIDAFFGALRIVS